MQGWGLHVWADVRSETEWQRPIPLQGCATADNAIQVVAPAIDVLLVSCVCTGPAKIA